MGQMKLMQCISQPIGGVTECELDFLKFDVIPKYCVGLCV